MCPDEPEHWAAQALGSEVRVLKVAPFLAERCRCGARLVAGVERFVISDPPATVEYLVKSRAFCSLACVRAFLLEALSEMETLSSPAVEDTVSDLRDAYVDLTRTFDELRFELTNPDR